MSLGAEALDLLSELRHITEELVTDHVDLAQLLAAEREGKIRGFDTSQGHSIKERENDASLETLRLTTDIFKLRGKIAGQEVRITYLTAAIAALT